MKRRTFLFTAGAGIAATGFLATGCTVTKPDTPEDRAAKRREIDSGVDGTLTRLYSTARGSQELAGRARGILIFPRVLSGGLVIGGEYGDGVLRVGGRPDGYYRLVGGSLGWQIGAQSRAIVLMFLTQDALDRFRKSSGWTVGADATVAVANVGATGEVDSNTIKQSVVGFALTNVGLFAGLKLDGSKITRLDL
ncbi:MAG TPA: YSC84-related protein [Burkholderiales bacterium]|nr:YSC84-related protein [Burkholderiales bacterium]